MRRLAEKMLTIGCCCLTLSDGTSPLPVVIPLKKIVKITEHLSTTFPCEMHAIECWMKFTKTQWNATTGGESLRETLKHSGLHHFFWYNRRNVSKKIWASVTIKSQLLLTNYNSFFTVGKCWTHPNPHFLWSLTCYVSLSHNNKVSTCSCQSPYIIIPSAVTYETSWQGEGIGDV